MIHHSLINVTYYLYCENSIQFKYFICRQKKSIQYNYNKWTYSKALATDELSVDDTTLPKIKRQL